MKNRSGVWGAPQQVFANGSRAGICKKTQCVSTCALLAILRFPSLVKFDVTKAAAKRPALQTTCEMLSSLQIHEYEQMRMTIFTFS